MQISFEVAYQHAAALLGDALVRERVLQVHCAELERQVAALTPNEVPATESPPYVVTDN